MLFNEFKDSNDYLMQKWFLDQKKQIELWFTDVIMLGYKLDLFDWISNDSYSMYTANLKFNNDKTEYVIDFEIDATKVVDGQVPEWILKIRAYDVDTTDLLAELDKTIQLSEWSIDTLMQLISDIDNKVLGKEDDTTNVIDETPTATSNTPEVNVTPLVNQTPTSPSNPIPGA